MPVFRDISIKQKLMRISLFTAGLALILSAAALTINEVIVFRQTILNELTVQTEIIGSNCTAALTFNDAKAAKEILSALRANRDIDHAVLFGKDGLPFADYGHDNGKYDVPPVLKEEGHRFGLNYVEVYHPIVLDNEVVGALYLHSNLHALYDSLFRYAGIFFAAILLSLGAVYALSSRLQMSITGLISDLARTMKTVSEEKDYSVRATVQSRDELGVLAEGFNEMLSRTQKALIERENAEQEVRRLNVELEMKVEERTRQLIDAQEELVRQEKLATLGQLSGSVGHELRNPLGVISNAVFYLRTVMPEADETVTEYLDIIKNEVDSSQRIITDLLDLTKTKTPRTRVVAIAGLIRQGLGKCVVPGNISLHLEIPDALPAVKVDPPQLAQVFQNLISNAIQAMPRGGELFVAARRAGSRERGVMNSPGNAGFDDVEITIIDTGEGISPENMKKLFQPLFTTKARGIGLGLIVARNNVEANGGRLKVDSRAGKGTTVTVLLPGERGDTP